MKNQKHPSLYRIITVFVAGLFLIGLTACGTPKVLAKENSTANKPTEVMQPSDLQQRQNVSGNDKVESLINGSKQNLERHGNYQGSNNPFVPETSVSEGATGLKNKLGKSVDNLRENLQNSAEDAQAAAKGAARTAKVAADDVSNKAQQAGYDLRSKTFNND